MKTNNLKLMVNRAGLQLKKYSPEIMVAAGVIGTVASTVLACRATIKANDILKESKKVKAQIDDVHDGVVEIEGEYTEDDYKKDLTVYYAQTAVQVAKTYAPAVSLGVASIASILGGYNVMKKRYVASVAAYSALNEGFREYRSRVVDKFGKEIDREMKYGIKAQTVNVTEVDENGEEKVVKKKAGVVTEGNLSEYAKMFTSESHCWNNNFDYNMMFLRAQEQYANDILTARGHLFLNEVYEMLGIPHTQAGQLVGWVKGSDGDGFVDFNLPDNDEIYLEHMASESEKKYTRCIPLDFNVDGYVLEMI